MIEIAKMRKLAKINLNQYHHYIGSDLVVAVAVIISSCTPKETAEAQSQQKNRPKT